MSDRCVTTKLKYPELEFTLHSPLLETSITSSRPTCSPHPANLTSSVTQSGVERAWLLGVCVCDTSLHISVTWGRKSQESKKSSGQRKKTPEPPHQKNKRPAERGDEDLPEPKSACAARSRQQPAERQQQRHESTQHGQHLPHSPAHPQHPSLQQ